MVMDHTDRGAGYIALERQRRRGPTWPVQTADIPVQVAVQRLIRDAMNAPGGMEQEGFLEVKVRLPYFGKPEHGWRTLLRLLRVLKENWPNAQVIGAGGIEMISDNSDDDSETWHTIDYKEGRTEVFS